MNQPNSNLNSEPTSNSSSRNITASKSSEDSSPQASEQKIILLPRNAHQEQSIWIGVLAKYLNIWAPTYPVSLKENGTQYTFDFHCESRSKLIKVFTLEDKNVIDSYLDLPYSKHIIFILDYQITDCDQRCYCRECGYCQLAYELAEQVDAYICFRDGAEINCIEEYDKEDGWDEVLTYKY